MTELRYECCPICTSVLAFRSISQKFDKDGSRFGFRLYCKTCGWFDGDRFYSREDVKDIKDTQGVEQ